MSKNAQSTEPLGGLAMGSTQADTPRTVQQPWYAESRLAGLALPPMLQQYVEFKRRYPECVLLFQVGDFYEIFFDDAVAVARAINLTLTSRDKGSSNPIPMCGVPIATVENYLERLLECGFSCAVVSQTTTGDDPAAKGGVPRKLTRIVTPGVRILAGSEGSAGEALCAAVALGGSGGAEREFVVAATNTRSGEITVSAELPREQLLNTLQALAPSEVLLPSAEGDRALDRRSAWVRTLERGLRGAVLKFRSGPLARAVQSAASQRELHAVEGFSALSPLTKRAVWGLVDYIDETTVETQVRFQRITTRAASRSMQIDAMTRGNLELVRNAREGGTSGTLFSTMNQTVSEPGARLLRAWIVEPLIDAAAIRARHQAVQLFTDRSTERDQLRMQLTGVADLERIVTRLDLGVVSPREIGALRSAVRVAELLPQQLNEILRADQREGQAGLISEVLGSIPSLAALRDLLNQSLADELPWLLSDGGVIRPGFDAELDRVRALKSGSASWMESFEREERERTGISSLKVRSNNVLGFFIEITRANISRVPADYQRRQSTAQAERFSTEALRHAEKEFFAASSSELELERVLFQKVLFELRSWADAMRSLSRTLATLDVLAALSVAAERGGWCRPTISSSLGLEIKRGRHPVISSLVGSRFVPNDLSMGEADRRLLVLTGPNMGGKSTYLRQAALIVIMAQMGSFVPAESAVVGLVDQVFARMGASDNLAEGESTFMVEMREMAHILSHATERSLLVIDEVGRGTATADGVAIARAIVEWLITRTKARTLFATHFHELTCLANTFPMVHNISVTSLEQGDEVVFTHHIAEGAASRSYGVEVAKLAGLPRALIERAAQELAQSLLLAQDPHGEKPRGETGGAEQGRSARTLPESTAQLALFASNAAQVRRLSDLEASARKHQEFLARIKSIDIDRTTPLEALEILNSLRQSA